MQSIQIAPFIEPIFFVLFVVFVIIFIYFGITLNHHWNYYSFNAQIKRIMKSLYFFVSILILLILLFFIGLYILKYGI